MGGHPGEGLKKKGESKGSVKTLGPNPGQRVKKKSETGGGPEGRASRVRHEIKKTL